jgi:hypothetical protein
MDVHTSNFLFKILINLPFIYHRDFGILKRQFRRENSCTFFTSPTKYSDCCEKKCELYKTVEAALRKASALSQSNNMMKVVVVAAAKIDNDAII